MSVQSRSDSFASGICVRGGGSGSDFHLDGLVGRVRVLGATALEHTPSAAPGEIVRLDASGLYVACGTGSLRIDSLQLPGKNPVALKALINGSHPFSLHQVLA